MQTNETLSSNGGNWSGRPGDVVHARRGILPHRHLLIANGNRALARQRLGILRDTIGDRAVPLPFLPGRDFKPGGL
jgi:hypothetical protein